MNFEEEVQSWLKEKGINFVEKVRIRRSDNSLVVYVAESYRNRTEITEVSDRKINKLKSDLERLFEFPVNIIRVKGKFDIDLEESLKVIINNRLDQCLVNFFLNFIDEKKAEAWVETTFSDQKKEHNVREVVESVMGSADIELCEFNWINLDVKVPSLLQVLMVIKVLQPVSQDIVLKKLTERGFYSVDERWVSAKLDQLRKKRAVIRQKNGMYAICSMGLSVLPQTYGRKSSDVGRALALGRNRWLN